ncbi:MAG: signal peptidase I [Desulfobacterium sp.]|nr:signal peptidase I [Desulfobacterium sp.]
MNMRTRDIITISIAAIILIPAVYIASSLVSGSTQLLIVLSGSMVPVIQVGDVIVVDDIRTEDVQIGDIIAFKDPGGRPNVLITHRVKEIIRGDNLSFQTKGDAVEDPDPFTVKAEDVVGKTVFVIPSLGYFIKSVKKPIVFFLFTLFPAAILIIDELKKIARSPAQSHRALREEKRKKRRRTILNFRRLIAILLIGAILFGAVSLFSLSACGYAKKEEGIFVENKGTLSCVLVFNTINKETFIPPVILSGNSSSVIKAAGIDSISTAPYIMPVFWVSKLSDINPYLPFLIISTLPPILIALLLFPAWYQKRDKHRKHFIKKLRKLLARV